MVVSAVETPTIVFVDDDSSLLDVVSKLFRNQPYRFETFSSPVPALDLLATERVHVVVSDLEMPDMDGFAFLEQVARLAPHATRVVLSAHADSESLLAAINRNQVHHFIVKPWEGAELVSVLKQAVETANLRLEREALLADLGQQSRRLSRQVDERTEQVMALSRPAELGKYTSQIVHNLKTPIHTIGASLFLANLLLEQQTPHREELQTYLDHAADGARELRRLVAGILLHTAEESFFHEEPVDINDVIRHELEFFEHDEEFKRQVVRHLRLEPALPPVNGNAAQLKQIVDNLIRNAVDAMKGTETRDLVITTTYEDGDVVIAITDSGEGIPKQHFEDIFSPFFTTKNVGDGIGLGLAGARRMVEAYGGRIEVASEVGTGSTFTVHLPTTPPAS